MKEYKQNNANNNLKTKTSNQENRKPLTKSISQHSVESTGMCFTSKSSLVLFTKFITELKTFGTSYSFSVNNIDSYRSKRKLILPLHSLSYVQSICVQLLMTIVQHYWSKLRLKLTNSKQTKWRTVQLKRDLLDVALLT